MGSGSQTIEQSATLPGNIIANLLGFTPVVYFEIEEAGGREVPQVSFPLVPLKIVFFK
jgi:hypothetical protein